MSESLKATRATVAIGGSTVDAFMLPELSLEEARELAKRALQFKQEKSRLPSLTAIDPWEKRMAEGVAFLQRKVKEETNV